MRLAPASAKTPGARLIKPGPYPVGPAGGYTPADFATAYAYNRSTAVKQTVGIVDAYNYPTAAADLKKFQANYGIPWTASNFVKVGQAGTTALPAADTTGWSNEEALDIEAVRAVCTVCKIILVEANSPTDANLSTAVASAIRLGATEVSNSYGGPEASGRFTATQAARYVHTGVVVTASTGDNGWYGWDAINTVGTSENSPEEPSSLPDVVAVGGTNLTLTSTGTRSTETVWDEDGPEDGDAFFTGGGASGGGCSIVNAAPTWQLNVAGWAKTGCGKFRLAADIAADADPYTGFDIYDSYNCGTACGTGWFTIGGTSLASPLVAGMWALAGGAPGVTNPVQRLYQRFATTSPGVFDVVRSGNAYCDADTVSNCTDGGTVSINDPSGYGFIDCMFKDTTANTVVANHTQCVATKGFDGPSGVGAPRGLNAFRAVP